MKRDESNVERLYTFPTNACPKPRATFIGLDVVGPAVIKNLCAAEWTYRATIAATVACDSYGYASLSHRHNYFVCLQPC